jgi:RND family efflux transporter MFP subunit
MKTHPIPIGIWWPILMLLGGAAVAVEEQPAKIPEVPIVRPVTREITDHEDFTGRSEASVRVDVRPRVSGYVLKAPFREGSAVKEGDLLFEIDPRIYRAGCDEAEAAVKLAAAQLQVAENNLKSARMQLAQKVISQEEFDNHVSKREEAAARVAIAKARLEAARLNLEATRVAAPIYGQIGRRLVDPGNLVKADETILATITRHDPLQVYFDLDERTYLRLVQSMKEGKRKEEALPVAIALSDEKGFPHRGLVNLIENQLNPDTGAVRVRAALPNKDGRLLPGMFVRVRLTMGEPRKVLVIPERAIIVEEGARFVYVVNAKDTLELREVTLGQQLDGQRVVTRGLQAEDRIVVERLQRLRAGMIVRPVEEEKPARPQESSSKDESRSLAPARGQPGPIVLVRAVYPGASAQVVAECIAAPIEQQVQGVEKLLHMRSQCTNNGTYTLALTFARGADINAMQVLVQNRVNLALPVLPNEVKSSGVSVQADAPDVQMIVNLSSPDDRLDDLFLSNYAQIQIEDELARLPDVGAVTLIGRYDSSLRIWLDMEKLAALNLSIAEVVRALEEQNLPIAAGRSGPRDADKKKGREITLNLLGRLMDMETLAEVILKRGREGRTIRLKDVANIEFDGRRKSQASFNGKSVVALVIHPRQGFQPGKLRAALQQRVADLRKRLPHGLDLAIPFDFTANIENPDRPANREYLLIDIDVPVGLSEERLHRMLQRSEALLGRLPGVQEVQLLSENPFDLFSSGPCLLIGLTPVEKRKAKRAEMAQAIREQLDEIKEMTVRLRDPAGSNRLPRFSYPIDLAVHGPEAAQVRKFARMLSERLGRSKSLADVWMNPNATLHLQRIIDIDGERARQRGVSLADITNTLQAYSGSLYIGDFTRFGRHWRMELSPGGDSKDWGEDVRKLKIRNARGDMVPLADFLKTREAEQPPALDLLDSQPMVEIAANLASGVTREQAVKLCEKVAQEVRKELRISAEYRLTWLLPG